MEAASENRGRGRPPKFPPEAYRLAEGGPLTRRGKQDRIYAATAIHLIQQRYPDEDWLIGGTLPKWTLLAELGRGRLTHGEASFWHATDLVLEERPSVKEAIRAIRRIRLNQP